MLVDAAKFEFRRSRPVLPAAADELRREENVFFVGGGLSPEATVAALFESDCQRPAELFVLRFAEPADFLRAEALVRSIKRNFKGFLLGQFVAVPPPQLLEHAYAAGIDFIDIPFTGERDSRLSALQYAQTVFPRWSVISTLVSGDRPAAETTREIDFLLGHGILPLVAVDREAAGETIAVFEHLVRGWRRRKAMVKPLVPLLLLTTPLVPPPRRGVVHGLLDRVDGARLRTASDLRRRLRVKEVEESFESAGL